MRLLASHTFSKPHAEQWIEIEIFRESLSIADPMARKNFLETQLQKVGSSLVEPAVTVQAVTTNLKPGDYIEVRERRLQIVRKAGEGRRGLVFQVRSAKGALYALKIAKDESLETLESLARESEKAGSWQALGIPHAKVLVQEKTYVLKPWINGIGGDDIIEKYSAGDIQWKSAVEAVISLVGHIRDQGAYVGDFRPANLIWTGKAWVIIDSGSIQQGMTLEETQNKWLKTDERGMKFMRRWSVEPPSLKPTCRAIFGA